MYPAIMAEPSTTHSISFLVNKEFNYIEAVCCPHRAKTDPITNSSNPIYVPSSVGQVWRGPLLTTWDASGHQGCWVFLMRSPLIRDSSSDTDLSVKLHYP
jgi:hypothetical protein